MDKILRSFQTHEQADQASAADYAAMTPHQRGAIALEIMRPHYEAAPDFREFCELANSANVPLILIGGWARNHYAEPRATGDINFFLPGTGNPVHGPSSIEATEIPEAVQQMGVAILQSIRDTLTVTGPPVAVKTALRPNN